MTAVVLLPDEGLVCGGLECQYGMLPWRALLA